MPPSWPRPWSDSPPARCAASSGTPVAPGRERGPQRRQVVLVGERDVERVAVDRPQLGHGQPDRLDRVEVLLGQRDVRDRRVVGAERDRDARRARAGPAGARPRDGTIPACQFEVGQRSSVTRRAMSSAHSSGSSTAPGPWAIRSGSSASARRTWHAPPHSPAWTVIRRPPARAASNAAAWASGSGNAASGPARSQPVRPWSRKRAAVSASVTFAVGVVRAQRRRDEPDDGPVPVRRVLRAAADRGDPVGQRRARPRRGAAAPSGSRRSGRRRPPWSRPARRRSARAPRRPASARSAGRTRAAARPGRRTASAR